MSIKLDISVGTDPIPSLYDITERKYSFFIGRKCVEFLEEEMPFTLNNHCADRALVEKHAGMTA